MWKFTMLAALLAMMGCKPSETAPAVPAPAANAIPAWQKRSEELAGLIKTGMTEQEVTKAAGEANRTKTIVSSGIALVVWEYDLGEHNYFKVRFDKDSRVASAKFESATLVQ